MAKGGLDKPSLIVAGPGAGKTWDMVQRIRESLNALSPTRYLAAITYTNAATASILRGLGRDGPIHKNIFVGTTHSFVNRFILLPFSVVLNKLPPERIFGAVNVLDHPAVRNSKNPQAKNAAAARITHTLLQKGVVPYDSMLKLAREIIAVPDCRILVSKRLQFLFIDEFQDADNRQLDIFDEIRKAGHTKIFGIGDPEQYITGFSYGLRGVSIPPFAAIPFFKFKDKSNCSHLTVNRRANQNLVDFLNLFRSDLTQTALKPMRPTERVVILKGTDLPTLCAEFRQTSEHIERAGSEVSRLFLGYENKLYLESSSGLGLLPISADHRLSQGLLCQAVELVSLAAGLSESKLRAQLSLSKLELRTVGMKVLNSARDSLHSADEIWTLLKASLKLNKSESRDSAVRNSWERLKEQVRCHAVSSGERYSTIHKSKGLEADAVLVVARTNAELKKWLVRDSTQRAADKLDGCRLGYVAFSRARELLAIGCLQPLDEHSKSLLGELGVGTLD